MKKYIIAALAVVCAGLTASAQMRTAYFMQGSTFRTDMNPALTPMRGYFNLPIVGSLNFDLNNNFLSVRNFIYPNPDGEGSVLFLHPSVDKQDFLKSLAKNNTLAFDTSLSLLNFGARAQKSKVFWRIGLNVKLDAEVVIPKDMFSLMTTLGQGHYDMSKLGVSADAYSELLVGLSIPVAKWLDFGFAVKGLLGIANVDMNINNTYVDITDTAVKADLRGTLRYSSIIAKANTPGDTLDFEDIFSTGSLGFKNFGGALDLGFDAHLIKDRLRISVAATDIGVIKWSKAQTVNGAVSAGFAYYGYDLDEGELSTESSDLLLSAGENKGYFKRLNTSLNVGAEYAFCKDRISIGVLSHTRFGANSTQSEITASANFRPLSWLSASVSHTFLCNNRLGVFGFALNIHPNGLNIFLGTDFIDFKVAKSTPVPVNLSSANVYFGFGFNFGKPHFYRNSKWYKG